MGITKAYRLVVSVLKAWGKDERLTIEIRAYPGAREE
jgi:hypothetical protein